MELPTTCIFNKELAQKLDKSPEALCKIAISLGIERRIIGRSRYYTSTDADLLTSRVEQGHPSLKGFMTPVERDGNYYNSWHRVSGAVI